MEKSLEAVRLASKEGTNGSLSARWSGLLCPRALSGGASHGKRHCDEGTKGYEECACFCQLVFVLLNVLLALGGGLPYVRLLAFARRFKES